MAFAGRFRELMKKYGKVALGVHFSVSAASIAGLYVAISNNVDVASVFERVGLSSAGGSGGEPETAAAGRTDGGVGDAGTAVIWSDRATVVLNDAQVDPPVEKTQKRNRTAELVASSGGALALAILCNKALFPVRVPITIALTPPIARFLARRNLIKTV